jgi:uncharacterized protein (TIGR03435 family)
MNFDFASRELVVLLIRVTSFFLATILVQSVLAQPAQNQSFEVASVKRSAEVVALPTVPRRNGTSITWTGTPIVSIIQYAFDLNRVEIEGAIPQTFYDIQTIVPDSATAQDVRHMFQTLLRERFGLKFHQENRSLNIYELQVGKRGLRVEPTEDERPIDVNGRKFRLPKENIVVTMQRDGLHLFAFGVTLDRLAKWVGDTGRSIVVNKTNVDGEFDIHLFHARLPGEGYDVFPWVKDLLEEELGFTLRSAKTIRPILVVDNLAEGNQN